MKSDPADLRELVVCSLEPWNDTWRRNQFLVHNLLEQHRHLRVLFIEPPADPIYDLATRHLPALPRLRSVTRDRRLQRFRPLKPLPRRAGPIADRLLLAQIPPVVRLLGFDAPVLWLNDVNYAPLIAATGWPTVYDITDDWLLAPTAAAELARLQHLEAVALRDAEEVVVCSDALVASRSQWRPVSLIRNAVDTEHFRRPQPRPHALPHAPVAVYVGTLHDARIDVELVLELARGRRDMSIALVGPDSLGPQTRARLNHEPNVHLLGSQPYDRVPAYLQHADVLIVPHLVSSFTESLDPIKAYECLAVDTPTVATPVAGFRELAGDVRVADRKGFVEAVEAALESPPRITPRTVPSWQERSEEFALLLQRAQRRRVEVAG